MQQASVDGVTTYYSYNTNGLISMRSNTNENVINVWDGDQLVMELDANKNVVTKYIRAFSDLIKAENGDGTLKWYYVRDTHGNVVQLIEKDNLDGKLKVAKSYSYDEFGIEKDIVADDPNPIRYCGEYYDKFSGTVYLRARNYSPGMGRFLQMDSYAGDYNNPLSLNLWTYCENDAVNYVDPNGHSPWNIYNGTNSGMGNNVNGYLLTYIGFLTNYETHKTVNGRFVLDNGGQTIGYET